MQQVLVIHGAGSFFNLNRNNFLSELKEKEVAIENLRRGKENWKARLGEQLGDSYDVLFPKMPDPDNPQYEAWKIWFEKILITLDEKVIIVGHSLGGIFLIKYFSETTLNKVVPGLFIIAAPFLGKDHAFENSTFKLSEDLSKVMQAENVFIYHSTDDSIVPFEDFEKYQKELSQATHRALENRGHFFDQEEFPELVADIKSVA